jgi:hypothetical protein
MISSTVFFSKSRQTVAAIDEQITARHVCRSIARQVQIEALDLLDMALPPKCSHPVRLIQRLRASAHLGVEESGRNNVDSGELAPLSGKGLAEVRHKGLGRVVDGLVDGDIHDVRAHARGDDKVAEALALEDLAGIL